MGKRNLIDYLYDAERYIGSALVLGEIRKIGNEDVMWIYYMRHGLRDTTATELILFLAVRLAHTHNALPPPRLSCRVSTGASQLRSRNQPFPAI